MTEYILTFLVLLFAASTGYLVYERYLKKTQRTPSTSYIGALRDLLDGKQEAAFAKLRQVVATDSQNLDAYLRLGQILRENNQHERALQVHKDLTLRADLSHAEKAAVLRQLAADYLAVDDHKMAEAALREIISSDSDDYWAYTQLLALQEETKAWDEACQTAVRILQLEANKSKKPLAQYKFKSGDQLFKKREYHKARIAYKEAIGLDPGYVAAYLGIGDSYREEGRLEDAVTFWNKLISAVPNRGHQVIDRLKKTLFDLGRYGDIQGICESILKHSPKNAEAQQTLAEFYEKKGDIDQAIVLLEQVVDDYPEDSLAVMELIRVHLEKGDTEKTIQLLRNLERKRNKLGSTPPSQSADSIASDARA